MLNGNDLTIEYCIKRGVKGGSLPQHKNGTPCNLHIINHNAGDYDQGVVIVPGGMPNN